MKLITKIISLLIFLCILSTNIQAAEYDKCLSVINDTDNAKEVMKIADDSAKLIKDINQVMASKKNYMIGQVNYLNLLTVAELINRTSSDTLVFSMFTAVVSLNDDGDLKSQSYKAVTATLKSSLNSIDVAKFNLTKMDYGNDAETGALLIRSHALVMNYQLLYRYCK